MAEGEIGSEVGTEDGTGNGANGTECRMVYEIAAFQITEG
jgi:hypothetical protein